MIQIASLSLANEVWQLAVILFTVGLFGTRTHSGVSTLSQTLIEDP